MWYKQYIKVKKQKGQKGWNIYFACRSYRFTPKHLVVPQHYQEQYLSNVTGVNSKPINRNMIDKSIKHMGYLQMRDYMCEVLGFNCWQHAR